MSGIVRVYFPAFFCIVAVSCVQTQRPSQAPNWRTPSIADESRQARSEATVDDVDADTFVHPPTLEAPEMDSGKLPPPVAQIAAHPLEGLSTAELATLLDEAPEELGCASLGRNSAGALFNGIPMPTSPYWNIVNPRETYGTAETIAYLSHTITRLNELFEDVPPLHIGDISRDGGGHLTPHASHQAGRDVDLGFYYLDQNKWYAKADGDNLDLEETWAFVKTTITETDVEVIFVDYSIQRLLREYAEEEGEDPLWLDQVFGGP